MGCAITMRINGITDIKDIERWVLVWTAQTMEVFQVTQMVHNSTVHILLIDFYFTSVKICMSLFCSNTRVLDLGGGFVQAFLWVKDK